MRPKSIPTRPAFLRRHIEMREELARMNRQIRIERWIERVFHLAVCAAFGVLLALMFWFTFLLMPS